MNQRFSGKVALVTGAASGLGKAIALRLAAEGGTVYCADRDLTGCTAVAESVGGVAVDLDVSREDAWIDVARRMSDETAGPDILVNAAGIEGNVTAGTLEATTLDDWHRVMSVNLDGTFLGCRTVLPLMTRKGAGAIVNVSSVASYYPTLQNVAYGASKAAVTQLTKTVAHEGGPVVRCNSVHPGMIQTPMLDSIFRQLHERSDKAISGLMTDTATRMPMERFGTPEEVAALVAFLASDEASYTTGSEFTVDGGWRLLR